MRSFLKYLILLICTIVVSTYDCDARIKYTKATRIGMIKNDETAAEKNYTLLQNAISKNQNIKLNGTFYVKFPQPIVLDYTLHITGGEMRIVSGNCFDFVDGGGFVAEKIIFRRENIDEGKALCGNWDKYGDLLVSKFKFINSQYYGRYLLQLSFEDINSDETRFGINKIQLKDSYLFNGGRVLFVNGVIWENCEFLNNTFESFPTTPICIGYTHSNKRYPNEADTYHYVETNYKKSVQVTIRNNKFHGKPVSYNGYYCSALVQSVVCNFNDNYLRDIINFADGKSMENATCYDAYLSCSEVYFTGNVIENMMSFSMNGASKPQCEIGKSKIDLLSQEGSKTIRCYENNYYTVDGEKFLAMGADRSSLYANIFANTDPVYTYKWDNNKIHFVNADLHGRQSSSTYNTFEILNSTFDVYSIKNSGLCIIPSNRDFNTVSIVDNTFNLCDSSPFYLFNQVYYENYDELVKGNLIIERNRFVGSSPKIVFNSADNVIIKDNEASSIDSMSNYYIHNNSGKETPIRVNRLDVDLPYTSYAQSGTSVVSLGSSTFGKIATSSPILTKDKALSGYVYLTDDRSLEFKIRYVKDNIAHEVVLPFSYELGNLSYCADGKTQIANKDKYIVIYNRDGLLFQIKYTPSSNKFYYYFSSSDVSENDKNTLIKLEVELR